MDTDFLQALCALTAVFAPLALAWWIASWGEGQKSRPSQTENGEPAPQAKQPGCYPLRSDL